jgi:hypothetical protein
VGEAIPLGHPLDLAFAEHVHGLITLDGPLCRSERPKPQPRIHPAFHQAMILFRDAIQVLALSELTILRERLLLLKALEGSWIGGVRIDSDRARERRMARVQHLASRTR